MQDEDGKLLLRVTDAAQRLSVCRTTVYTLVNNGEMGYIRVGQSIRIPVEELNKWVNKQAVIFTNKVTL